MAHLDEEQVQRLLDGEMPRLAETAAREHLALCEDCSRRVAQAKREEAEVSALLRAIDEPQPAVRADAVAARAGARHAAWGRWAAALLIALGLAGGAYALPGSPLPALVQSVVAWIGGGPEPSPHPSPPPPGEAPDPGTGGIAVTPGASLSILFTAFQPEGTVRVSLSDGADVVVRAPIGAAAFNSDADRLVIDNAGSSATFEIQIPRAAPLVEILVGGGRLFLKEGSRVTVEGTANARDPYVLPLSRGGS